MDSPPAITYFIGGIATDRRLYEYPMASYAQKFIPLIDTAAPFNILANSMGGIMTMELIKHITPRKVILVSSVKCRAEMPFRLKQLKYSRLHRLLPGRGFIAGVEYGSLFLKELRVRPGLRKTVVEMARNNSPAFLYWCVNAIVNWEGAADYRQDIIHLHGTKDAMFPLKNIRNVVPVAGGTHNMLLTRSAELTALILQNL